KGGTQTRHVEVLFRGVDIMLLHDLSDEPLAFRMMDELRLQLSKYLCNLRSSLVFMYLYGVVRRKRLLEHLPCEANQGVRAGSRGQDEDVASVKPAAPLLVPNR